jgi:hypothetical protein
LGAGSIWSSRAYSGGTGTGSNGFVQNANGSSGSSSLTGANGSPGSTDHLVLGALWIFWIFWILEVLWIFGISRIKWFKFGKWNSLRYCYLYSLFNGTNTLTTSIVTQQTINVNSTALTINGQSQSVYFEVGALLQYSVPNGGEIKVRKHHINRYSKLYYLSQTAWNLATNTSIINIIWFSGIRNII